MDFEGVKRKRREESRDCPWVGTVKTRRPGGVCWCNREVNGKARVANFQRKLSVDTRPHGCDILKLIIIIDTLIVREI